MARPSQETTTGTRPEPLPESTSDQNVRRKSYIAGEPESAPELVQFMKYATEQDIENIETKDLLIAVQQTSLTIANWEVVIVTLKEQLIDFQKQIDDLQTQNQDLRKAIRYLEQ